MVIKLVDILKSRWQEAVMVAGLQACFVVLALDFMQTMVQSPSFGQSFLFGIILPWFWIICQMMLWGFLRTAVIGGAQSVSPMELLRTGKGYFWKLLLFHLMITPIFGLIFIAIVSGVQVFSSVQVNEEEIPLWLKIIAASTASLVLIKPLYFVPAQILRKDCGIWDAIQGLKQTRLLEMRYFMITAISIMILGGIIEYKSWGIETRSAFYFPVMGVQAVISASGTLVLFLAAVLEVDRLIPKKTEESNEEK